MALSPRHILTMKSNVVMPPPGVFGKPDLCCRSIWRRIQGISNEFWSQWWKEFWWLCKRDRNGVHHKETSMLVIFGFYRMSHIVASADWQRSLMFIKEQKWIHGFGWSVQLYIGNSKIKCPGQLCIGAINIEHCFVGQVKQKGPIPDGWGERGTVNKFGQDNHRWSWEEPVVHGHDSTVGSHIDSYIGP